VDELVRKAAEYVRAELAGRQAGHDWWHTWRVWRLSRYIAGCEGAELPVVELAALLHDLADWKFSSDEQAGQRAARAWLSEQGAARRLTERVCEAIASVSFKGAGVPDAAASLEAKVVQDADRLDAIGAIGIARAFAYGGYKGRSIYEPQVLPQQHGSFEQYRRSASPTINHFYEKLLLLKDRLHTATARRIAQRRHEFMLRFLDEFFREWRFAEQCDSGGDC